MIARAFGYGPRIEPDAATMFLRWTYLRAVFHRGYVLASGLYFVVDARLSAFQLVILGTVMSATLVLSDVPAGVWSDAFSRKWPLVIGHGFLASGMVMTGLVTVFPLILVTQVLWGLGWAFSGGADVAWLTDELDRPDRIARVLTARARWDLVGGATGVLVFGALAWATDLPTAVVVSGAAMALLGLVVAARFTEDNFTPVREQRWGVSLSTFRRGLALARRDQQILLVFAATMLINGASEAAWVNRRTTSDVRATMHSFLSQAESIGEILGGSALAVLTQAAGVSGALITSAVLVACAGAVITRSRTDTATRTPRY